MLATLLVLLSSLGGAPPASHGTVVVVTRRQGVTAAEAQVLARRTSDALAQAGVAIALDPAAAEQALAALGVSDPASCDGEHDCAVHLGSLVGSQLLVAVEVGGLRKTVALQIQVLDPSGAAVAADELAVARSEMKTAPLTGLDGLAVKVREFMAAHPAAAPAAARPADVPVARPSPAPAAEPHPVPVEPAVEGLRASPPPRPRTAAWITSGVAAGALVTAGVFGLMGRSQQSQIGLSQDGGGRTIASVPESRATELKDNANRDYAIGAAALGTSLALGAVSAWLFATSP